jgi:thiamine biosynthesis lipoprotein
LLLSGCSQKPTEPYSESTFALDTIITITLFEENDDLMNDVFNLIDDYESLLSRHIQGSETDQINTLVPNQSMVLSPDMLEVITSAISYSKLSNGLFDITIGPLSKLWQIGSDAPDQKPPTELEIAVALEKVGYRHLIINDDALTLSSDNVTIDLGGIAKGFIADKIVELLVERDISQAILNLGGNVYVHGTRTPTTPYVVGIQNPDSGLGAILGKLSLSNSSVVTSGIYERFFIYEDITYHHILDPRSGYPINNSLKSVSIISRSSMDGDALSTTLFLMGLDEGFALAESLDGIDAIFVTHDNHVFITSELKDNFELTNENFFQKEM